MRIIIQQDYKGVSAWAAAYVARCINDFKPTPKKPFVLGLPTGSSPLGMYKRLIQLNRKKKVSFANVVTFNMDEYVNLPKDHPESYYSFMWNNFFKYINIKKSNVNILNGNAKDLQAECTRYEKKIKRYGGIELFVGGIGPDGHIAFNEMIIVNGHNKARALAEAVEGGVNHMLTVSCLQMHPHGIIVCDDAATVEMKVATANYFKDIEKKNLNPEKILKG